MKNKLSDVRNHLVMALENLLDEDNPMDIKRAKAVADVAQVLVNSAKVEVDFIRITDGSEGTGFIDIVEPPVLQNIAEKRLDFIDNTEPSALQNIAKKRLGYDRN